MLIFSTLTSNITHILLPTWHSQHQQRRLQVYSDVSLIQASGTLFSTSESATYYPSSSPYVPGYVYNTIPNYNRCR
jgi:hypothetical protein